MDKRILIPNTDLSVYPIGLGTADAGLLWDGAEADKVFDTYLGVGGNLIDCAHVYNDWVPGEIARAERVLGDWLQRSGKRNEVVLITKGGHPKYTSPSDDLHIPRMSHADMVGDLESSLKQLRVDTIDIYFYHRDNEAQSVEEEIETMEEFRKQGKIRYYGCSNWSAARMQEADAYCASKGYRGFVANQALLNLGAKYMNPLADDTLCYIKGDMYEYHKATPTNLAMPYMGNASGFFHIYDAGGEAAVKNNPYYTPGNVKVAQRVQELKAKYGCTITQCVLGFFFQQEFPCVPLYGPKIPEHIVDAAGTLDVPFVKADYDI